MRTVTIHRTCLHCASETTLTVPAHHWDSWTTCHSTRALAGLDPDTRRWLTTMTCPTCHRTTITDAPADYLWEGRCAGCGRWETFAVPTAALHAINTGDLTADQALPRHTDDQRCLLEMHCHVDCYCDAVYGRPPGEPNPFAHQ